MKLKQIQRLSLSIIIFLSVIILTQALLKLPILQYIFSPAILNGKDGIWIWILTWILIFLDAGCIPGPYLPIIVFCSVTPMVENLFLFVLFSTSAVAAGRSVAYFIGQKTAGKLLKWSAQNPQEYEHWIRRLSSPTGKIIYAITVAAPGFPDFILALIAGSIKINFMFYMIVNILCKGVENYLLAGFGFLLSGFNKFIYIYIIVIIVCLMTFIITNVLEKKN